MLPLRQLLEPQPGADNRREAAESLRRVVECVGAQRHGYGVRYVQQRGQDLHFLRCKSFEGIHKQKCTLQQPALRENLRQAGEIVQRIEIRVAQQRFICAVNQGKLLCFHRQRPFWQRFCRFFESQRGDRALL